jgi:hypothetical protein
VKFKDYETKKAALEATERQRYEAGEVTRMKLDELRKAVRREWSLGPPLFLDSGMKRDRGVVVATYGVMYAGLSLVVRDPAVPNYDQEVRDRYEMLSAAQWRLFADVIATLTAWRAGDLSDLPPSGVWPGAEGVS